MYSTSAVMLATIMVLQKRGFDAENNQKSKDSESVARRQMMFTAIRSLTAQTPCTTVALMGLNPSAAKGYEERDSNGSFWRSQKDRDDWVEEVRQQVIQACPETIEKPFHRAS
jgi:hypothetical protein